MVYHKHPFKMDKKCVKCCKEFVAKTHSAIYCEVCRENFKSPYKHLSTGTVGAIAELMVCNDLMRKGYEVFRAVSPACSCDVAILKENKLLRVQVKTGYRNKWNNIQAGVSPKEKHKYDILAIVIHKTNEIIYYPNL